MTSISFLIIFVHRVRAQYSYINARGFATPTMKTEKSSCWHLGLISNGNAKMLHVGKMEYKNLERWNTRTSKILSSIFQNTRLFEINLGHTGFRE